MNARHDSEEPRDWLEYAKANLQVAEHMLRTMQPCPYWIVTYHAQQCVEKSLLRIPDRSRNETTLHP